MAEERLLEWEISSLEDEGYAAFIELLRNGGELNVSGRLLLMGKKVSRKGEIISKINTISLISRESTWSPKGDYTSWTLTVRTSYGYRYLLNSGNVSTKFCRTLKGFGLEEKYLPPL